MKKIFFLFSAATLVLLSESCKDKYERPSRYSEDLFADERIEADVSGRILSHEEALEKSTALVVSNSVKLIDSSSSRSENPLFVYKIDSGVFKKSKDSTSVFPMYFISGQFLKLNKDSSYIYLGNVNSFKLVAKQKNINYQFLSNSPIDKP